MRVFTHRYTEALILTSAADARGNDQSMIPAVGKGYLCTGGNRKNRGNHDYSKINVHSTQGKLYIFGKERLFSFQKYVVFLGYYGDIFLAVNMISPIFPIFPGTLAPFLLIPNRMWKSL